VIERRDEVSAGKVRDVVLDAMEWRADCFGIELERGGKFFFQSRESRHDLRAFHCEFRHAQRVPHFCAESRPGISRDGEVIHFRERDSGFLKAILNRLDRQSGSVLYAIEAFLFDCGEQLAVSDDRR
jgi:hypothetical protein